MANTLYASFVDRDQAVRAAGALLDHGVRNEDLSVITQGTDADLERYRTAHEGGEDAVEEAEHAESSAKHGLSVTTPADASAGAAKGAGVGLGVGIALGLASLVVPGFGLVFGGGALATALAGAALTTGAGAVAGGVTGYLKDQGVPEDAVATYNDVVTGGGAVVALTLPSNDVGEIDARDILTKYGAQNVGAYGVAS